MVERMFDLDPSIKEMRNSKGDNLLHMAVLSQNESMVRLVSTYMISYINRPNNFRMSPLHYATLTSVEIVTILINMGCFLEITDSAGRTPLVHAIFHSKHDIIEFLIRRGCDINSVDYMGDTPLHHASRCRSGRMVELISSSEGCNINSKNFLGETPLHIGCGSGSVRVVEYLTSHGSSCVRDSITITGKTPEDYIQEPTHYAPGDISYRILDIVRNS